MKDKTFFVIQFILHQTYLYFLFSEAETKKLYFSGSITLKH